MIDGTMTAGREQQIDILIVGGGIAGLRAAIEAAADAKVLLLTKSGPAARHAPNASAALPFVIDADELTVRPQETIRSGGGLCREEAVRALAEAAAAEVNRAIEWGARLEMKSGSTAARRGRTLRAETGLAAAEIRRALLAQAKTLSSFEMKSSATATDLIVADGKITGVRYFDEQSVSLKEVHAEAVIVATGGLGRVYDKATHGPGAWGDGVAMAHRAGALLSDLEFVEFYPTVLSTSPGAGLILSAGLLERGAVLRNVELERFMHRHHEAGELAPRDVLARAIMSEMQRGRSNFVYIDLSGLDPEHVKRDFPRLYAACLESNIDITSDLIPTHPAAYFGLGGIAVDVDGATTLPGLYAAGESAATGVHGASHFGNNPLLESLVFGARTARAALRRAPAARFPPPPSARLTAESSVSPIPVRDPAEAMRQIRRTMWEMVGLMRDRNKLKQALRVLDAMALPHPHPPSRQCFELQSAIEAARLTALSAEARHESRGAHYRTDYPLPNASEAARHSYISRSTGLYFQ